MYMCMYVLLRNLNNFRLHLMAKINTEIIRLELFISLGK